MSDDMVTLRNGSRHPKGAVDVIAGALSELLFEECEVFAALLLASITPRPRMRPEYLEALMEKQLVLDVSTTARVVISAMMRDVITSMALGEQVEWPYA